MSDLEDCFIIVALQELVKVVIVGAAAVTRWLGLVEDADAPAGARELRALGRHLGHGVHRDRLVPVRVEVVLRLAAGLGPGHAAAVHLAVLRAGGAVQLRQQLHAVLARVPEDLVNVGLVLAGLHRLDNIFMELKLNFCEAQGKGRARGGPRKVTQRSFIDGGWCMVDILSLMLYTKFGCHITVD